MARRSSPVVKAYLLAYNGTLTAGWLVVLARVILYTCSVLSSGGNEGAYFGYVPGLYEKIRWPLVVFQTAAIMEVVHCVLGIVSSAVGTTLMQVYSRLFIVWVLMEGVVGVQDNMGVILVSYAWGITEVVRYGYYFFSLVDVVPYFLVWCRYTFFFVLYPVGVLGELLLFFQSLPVVMARGQWNYPLPNSLNISFNFYYYLVFTMVLYIPLFPQLYGHMIKQRRKIIGGSVPDKKKSE